MTSGFALGGESKYSYKIAALAAATRYRTWDMSECWIIPLDALYSLKLSIDTRIDAS